jgi:Transcriptional regulators
MTVDSTSVPPRVLLADVARLAGVSRTTASFVLTGRTEMGISAGAADRVRQAARDLGYRPSLVARSLRTNASHTIGLLSDGLGGELFAGELIRGTLAAAVLHDKMIFVGETGGDPVFEARLVNSMLDRGAGAFVYASQRLRRVRLSTVLRAQQVVLVNCTTGRAPCPR